MRKHRKNRWKSIRPYLLTELIAVVMAVLLAATIYFSNRATVLADIEERMNQYGQYYVLSASNVGESMSRVRFMLRELNSQTDYRDCTVVAFLCELTGDDGEGEESDDSAFSGGGLFLEGTFAYLEAFYSEDSREASGGLDVRDYLWDLKKFFSKKDIDALVGFIPKDSTGEDDWTKYKLVEVRGRKTGDGHFQITGMRVTKENDLLELRSPEFRETDEAIPENYRTEDGRQGRVSLQLHVITQNPEMSTLVNTFRNQEADRGKYFWKVFDNSDPRLNSQNEINERIEHLRAGDGGEISYMVPDRSTPSTVFYVLIDHARITWNRTLRKMICIAILLQGYAILAMILVHAGLRKKEERRQLHATFVNAMAHELKTPAAVVRNTAEYLATGAKPEKQDHYINVLTRESESMDTLLNRMLTYTRVLDGNVEFKPVKTDLSKLAEEAIIPYTDLIAEKWMTVDLSVRPTVTTKCDPALMSMVIDNLISNAVRYGNPGSRIVVRLNEMVFSVWNEAEALSEEDLASVWTPMFVSERRAKDSETGGMGLAISAGILKRHGFTYGASNVENGLLFWIKLAETKGTDKQESDDSRNNGVVWSALCFSLIPLYSVIAGNDDWSDLVIVGIWMAFCIFEILIRTYTLKKKKKQPKSD